MKHLWRVLILMVLILTMTGCGKIARLSPAPQPTSDHPLGIIEQPLTAAGSRLFLPVVAHIPPPPLPVEGGHAMPRWSTSYYIMTTNPQKLFDLGCAVGLEDLNAPGTQDNLVILDFGQPKAINGVYGTNLFKSTTFGSVDAIGIAAQNFGWGYYVCTGGDTLSTLKLAIGTTNYKIANNSSVTYEHGLAWANMVNQVNDWLVANTTNTIKQQVTAVGANDIELSWNYYSVTREWMEGYDSANRYALYNFGALPGCPRLSAPNTQCGSYPYVWSKEQVWYVIYGAGPVYPLPEIYLTNGVNAEQWYLMAVYGAVNHGTRAEFVGSLTTYQACLQVGGCRNGTVGIDNTPEQGWNQLYKLLNGDVRTAQGLRWATDILWTNTGGTIDPLALAVEPVDAVDAQQKELFLADSLRTALQSEALSPDARLSLEEKLEMAAERAPQPQSPAPKDRPSEQALQALAVEEPVFDTTETIVEGSEGILRPSQAQVNNLWSGLIAGRYLQVLAGSLPDHPDQGLVVVVALNPGDVLPSVQFHLGPSYTGSLRILERQGDQLLLQGMNGESLRFNLVASQFE